MRVLIQTAKEKEREIEGMRLFPFEKHFKVHIIKAEIFFPMLSSTLSTFSHNGWILNHFFEFHF